jgi:hypothetical protein
MGAGGVGELVVVVWEPLVVVVVVWKRLVWEPLVMVVVVWERLVVVVVVREQVVVWKPVLVVVVVWKRLPVVVGEVAGGSGLNARTIARGRVQGTYKGK